MFIAPTTSDKAQPLCDPVYILNHEILSKIFLSGFGRSDVALVGGERLSIINQIHHQVAAADTAEAGSPTVVETGD